MLIKKIPYLLTIKDTLTNEIVAHNLSNNLSLYISINTIKKLKSNTKFKLDKDEFIHSDQVFHYARLKFQRLKLIINN